MYLVAAIWMETNGQYALKMAVLLSKVNKLSVYKDKLPLQRYVKQMNQFTIWSKDFDELKSMKWGVKAMDQYFQSFRTS